MRLINGAALGAFLLAACNNGTGNDAANRTAATPPADNRFEDVTPPPAPPQPDLEGARVLIGQIYQPYTRGETPQTGRLYTPELALAIARQSDTDTGLGYDPFCRCQDFENFRYTIESVERDGGGALARVAFTNLGERHIVSLQLNYRDGRWLVADIREGNDSLLAGGRR